MRNTLPLSIPPEKQTPSGSRSGTDCRILRDLFRQRADVSAADLVEIGGQERRRRIEEARVLRIGIRTSDQLKLHHMVGRHHAGVTGMKLRGEPFRFQPVVNGVDAVGHNQHRTGLPLGEKVAHGAIERARHDDGFALARDQRERTLDLAGRFRRVIDKKLPRRIGGQIVNPIRVRIEKIDDSFYVLFHWNYLFCNDGVMRPSPPRAARGQRRPARCPPDLDDIRQRAHDCESVERRVDVLSQAQRHFHGGDQKRHQALAPDRVLTVVFGSVIMKKMNS